jgi:Xaa-Pro aminopeptidase
MVELGLANVSHDADLEDCLRQAGVSEGAVADLPGLIAGIAAAPPGFEADAWMRLVHPEPPRALREALRRAVAVARARQAAADTPDAGRINRLRRELARRRLAGFIVPRSDAHQGEYVPAACERLRWLTGFTGSAGNAVVLAQRAAFFADGRYTTQAREEVDGTCFELQHAMLQPMTEWIARHLPASGRLGYDPWLHTAQQVELLEGACIRAQGRLVAVADNPIDRLWTDRPPMPIAAFLVHDARFAGTSAADKRAMIAEELRRQQQVAAVLAQPDAIAWLLNIRGGDVPFAPLPLAFALIHADASVELFCDLRKLTVKVRRHLGEAVVASEPAELETALTRLGEAHARVRADPDGTPFRIVRLLQKTGATVDLMADPCLLPKATKNAIEVAGIRAAHRRDGAALSRFLAWLARVAPGGELTEIAAADQLARFREMGEHYRGPSFPTISGSGANGAIVHYRATPATDRKLAAGSLYLVDSGGQYLDGTTDVTRTLAIGTPTAEMRQCFTRVLQGHIALATAVFPRGTTGSQLDAFARAPLWRDGIDYDHGTGHGVGAYLSVHEGPQRISKLPNRVALEPGMVLSNEPGFYKEGAYGIRIENLVAVARIERENSDLDLYGFETLTLAPIDRTLIDRSLLSDAERCWIDAYHQQVRETLTPMLDATTLAWLREATLPLP